MRNLTTKELVDQLISISSEELIQFPSAAMAVQEAARRIATSPDELEEAKTAIREWFALQEKIRKSPPPPHTDYWHQSIWYAEKKLKDVIGESE